MAKLRTLVDRGGATNRVLIPPEIDLILRSVDELVKAPQLPGYLSFTPVTGRPVTVTLSAGVAGFRADIAFLGEAHALFELPASPSWLVPAEPRSSGSGAARQEWLEPLDQSDPPRKGRVRGELVLRIAGTPNTSATMRLLPKSLAEDGVLSVRLDPPALLFGRTGLRRHRPRSARPPHNPPGSCCAEPSIPAFGGSS